VNIDIPGAGTRDMIMTGCEWPSGRVNVGWMGMNENDKERRVRIQNIDEAVQSKREPEFEAQKPQGENEFERRQ
jgi:hypothetical protein